MTGARDDAHTLAGLSEGVREKLRRGRLHSASYDRKARSFIEGQPYAVIRRDDAENGRRSWVLQVEQRPPGAGFAALIGDCLFNYRTLHVVGAATVGASHWGDEPPFDWLNLKQLEDGDDIARGPLPLNPETAQDLDVSFGVAFAQDGPGRGYEVSTVLHWIGEHIEKGVLKPLVTFLQTP